MQDHSNAQRAKARAMMPGMASGVSNLAREMTNPAPRSPAARLAPGPADKYVRPGTGSKERPMSAYANGGKVQRERGEKEVIEFSGDELEKMDRVGRNDSGGRYKAATEAFKTQLGRGKTLGAAKDAADVMRSRYANGGKVKARMAESRGMERAEMRKDMAQDKKMIAQGVHKHERHLHKGQPLTKLKDGGKVKAKVDEREVIEFSGDELADMDNRISHMRKNDVKRDFPTSTIAGAIAHDTQRRKGKSFEAADDAYRVIKDRTQKGLAHGGKVGKYAMGGAAKMRKGQAKPVSKMPKGGNPVY